VNELRALLKTAAKSQPARFKGTSKIFCGLRLRHPRIPEACWFFICRGVWALRMAGGPEVCAGSASERAG